MPRVSRSPTGRASWCRAIAIRAIADLKGKRVGFTKGSSAHNVVVQTLEKAGLTYADITPVYLTPPDAGPAFANGSIDAWAIWDPYFAIGETKQNGRILVNAVRDHQDQFVLHRQPRFRQKPRRRSCSRSST